MEDPHLSIGTILFAVARALGGVAIFLFGMEELSDGLQKAAGHQLRLILQRLTANPFFAFLGGTFLATLVHSGPTTVMVVGFINAGLVNIVESIGVIFGANVGTALSMQFFAFDIGVYCLPVIAAGFWIRMVARRDIVQHLCMATVGFGLLFLGMETVREAMGPLKHSPEFVAMVGKLRGDTAGGLFFGVLMATALTALLQSSGAMIAITFSLANAGVITRVDQAFPIIIGAHIGTCLTAIISSIGTNIFARRAALAHLAFNIISGILFIAMIRVYSRILPMTSGDLVRQIANTDLLKQLCCALLLLPLTKPYSAFIRFLSPSKDENVSTTFLDPNLVKTPELAILAATKELRRQAGIVRRMLETSLDAVVALDLNKFTSVLKDEESVNTIKKQFDRYVVRIAERQISKRQSLMLQHLIASSNDIERLGDHIKTIGVLTRTKIQKRIWFDDENMMALLHLGRLVAEMLSLGTASLDPTQKQYRDLAEMLLKVRKDYKQRVADIKKRFNSTDFDGPDEAVAAMYYMRYVTLFDRMVRHLRGIAKAELMPEFKVENAELERVAEPAVEPSGPPVDFKPATSYREVLNLPPRVSGVWILPKEEEAVPSDNVPLFEKSEGDDE